MRFVRTVSVVVVVCLAVPAPGNAQDLPDYPTPAHLAFVDGGAVLIRESQTEPAVPGTPLIPGDRIRTERGRIDVLLSDGSTLDLDEYSALELLSPTLLRLTEGRLLLMVGRASNLASALRFDVDTPAGSVQTDGPGEFRIAVQSGPSGFHTELAVVRGSGTITTDGGSVFLRAAERSGAWDHAPPSHPQSFNSARFDAFERWAAERRDERTGSSSARYLPSDLRVFAGALDRHGAWQHEAPHGDVWYPTVAEDWRPYDEGYWSSVPTYGWTWIGTRVWSWPTHHYGRWALARNRWFWIPDRRWAPAWVSWGAAPGFVTWCPLGYDNRPVVSLSIASGSRLRGWTVLSREHFGVRGRNVRQYAMSTRTFPSRTPFVEHTSPPMPPPHAPVRRLGGAESVAPGGGSSAPRGAALRRRAPSSDARLPAGPARSGQTRTTPPGEAPTAGRSDVPRDREREVPSRPPIVAEPSPRPSPSIPVVRQRDAGRVTRGDATVTSGRPLPRTPEVTARPVAPRGGRTRRTPDAPAPAVQAPPAEGVGSRRERGAVAIPRQRRPESPQPSTSSAPARRSAPSAAPTSGTEAPRVRRPR